MLTIIEWFALVIVAVSAIKIIVLLINPKAWWGLVKEIWSVPVLTGVIAFILATIVLYYLTLTISIVEIFAVLLFLALLAAVGISVYHKEVLKVGEKLLKDKKILAKSWFYILIWTALIVWALISIF